MLQRLNSVFPIIGVDAGSSRIRVVVDGQGVIYDQPSLVAVNMKTNRILAIGDEALAMQDRVASHIIIHRPFQMGEVYDLHWAKELLQVILQKSLGFRRMLSPTFVFSLPASATPAAHQVYSDLFFSLGGGEVISVATPLAAGIGAGIPIADSSGSFIFHGGDSLVEAVVISLGSIIGLKSEFTGIDFIKKKLKLMFKNEYELEVSSAHIGQLIHQVDFISQSKKPRQFLISGKNLRQGSPSEIAMYDYELRKGLTPFIEKNAVVIKSLLARLQIGLASDVISKGILITGGIGKLSAFDQALTQELGVSVTVVDQPEQAALLGLQTVIENIDEFKSSLGYTADVATKLRLR